jgi:hypothetical protein
MVLWAHNLMGLPLIGAKVLFTWQQVHWIAKDYP